MLSLDGAASPDSVQVAGQCPRSWLQTGDLVMQVGEGLQQHILELQQTAHLILQLLQTNKDEIFLVKTAQLFFWPQSVWGPIIQPMTWIGCGGVHTQHNKHSLQSVCMIGI